MLIAAGITPDTARPDSRSEPVMAPAPWGYTIRAPRRVCRFGRVWSTGGKLVAAALLLAAAAQWVVPAGAQSADLAVMKLAATVLFLILGGTLAWSTRREAASELQVDLVRHELRLGTQRGQGRFQPVTVLHFRDVGAVCLVRDDPPWGAVRLFLQVGRGSRALEVAGGSEAVLERLRRRLAEDIGVARGPVRRAADGTRPL